MTCRASSSFVSRPVTRSRSSKNSSSGYAPSSTPAGASCAQRRFRVWRLLPPRISRGAHSSTIQVAPASRAVSAAHIPALPPPTTTTSCTGADTRILGDAGRPEQSMCDEYCCRAHQEHQRDRTRHEDQRIPLADGEGAAELLLRERPEDEAQHR